MIVQWKGVVIVYDKKSSSVIAVVGAGALSALNVLSILGIKHEKEEITYVW